jgi:hypothetical protein
MVVAFATAARICVGLVFLAAAASKIRSADAWHAFAESAASLAGRPLGRYRTGLARAILAAEIAVAALVAWAPAAAYGLVLAGLLTLGFTVATVLARRRGSTAACACFGNSAPQPLWSLVLRNALILAATGLGLAGAPPAAPTVSTAAAGAGLGASFLIVGIDYAVSILGKER